MVLLLPDLSADFFARFAALRPSKPGLPPSTLKKPRVLGSPGLLGAAAREPAAQGIILAAACTVRLPAQRAVE